MEFNEAYPFEKIQIDPLHEFSERETIPWAPSANVSFYLRFNVKSNYFYFIIRYL